MSEPRSAADARRLLCRFLNGYIANGEAMLALADRLIAQIGSQRRTDAVLDRLDTLRAVRTDLAQCVAEARAWQAELDCGAGR